MDSRTAAHVLTRIAQLLELQGENRFKARAYATAGKAVLALNVEDIRPLLASGALAACPGVGPATLSSLRELAEHGSASYLEQLEEDTPEGLLDVDGAAQEIDLTEKQLHELVGQLKVHAGVET